MAQNQAIVEEYGDWIKIRSNLESCRQEFQKTSPDPSSSTRNEYDAHLQEIKSTWDLANYEVIRTYHAISQVESCLSTVRTEAQRLSESLLIEPDWAKALAKFKDDLEGLEQRLVEMLPPAQAGPIAAGHNPNKSAERIDLLDRLTGELSSIKIRMTYDGMTLAEVREQYPDYEAWKLLDEHGYEKQLENAEFYPKQLAERLTMHRFHVSQATLQKDRQNLRKYRAKFSGQ
jgi:hypothetical protein